MEIKLNYIGDKKFEAKTTNSSFTLDCKEITPVEYFATGLIGCTGIDLVAMAQNDGYEVKNYTVNAQIERQLSVPYKFNSLHLVYRFEGDFDELKAKRYILSSLESYCTTINTVRDAVKITYTIIYNSKVIADTQSILSGSAATSVTDTIEDGFGGACGS